MAASDAVGDLVTLSQAFGQFSNSLLSLFDARVTAESNRIAVNISNRQTDFLMDFDRAPDDPRAINTHNWQQRLDEYTQGIQGDLGSIQSEPVRNAVTRMYSNSQNQFRVQVADKMGQKMIMETRDEYAASLFGVQNGTGSAALRAQSYRSLLDSIPDGYFSSTEKKKFEIDYRQLQAKGWVETNLSSASDPTLPFEEASQKGLDNTEATQDQRSFMQTDIKGRSDAADKAADSVLKNISDRIKGGVMSYEQAMNQLKSTTSSLPWRQTAEAKVGLLVDDELVRQAISFVTAWESLNPEQAADAKTASYYRQMVLALGEAHTEEGRLKIQKQLEKIKIMGATEADKRRTALARYGKLLEAYHAGPAGNMTGKMLVAAVTQLRGDIPDVVNNFMDDFRMGKIQDNDGYIKAFRDVSTNKTLIMNISGTLGTKTKLGKAFNKIATDKDKAKATLEYSMVDECLMTIADAMLAQDTQGLKMKESELNAFAIKTAVAMSDASQYWDMALLPNDGETKDLEEQLYNFYKLVDTGALKSLYQRDQYYNQPEPRPFTQVQINISSLIKKKCQEGMDKNIPELQGYNWKDLTPRMFGSEMCVVTGDGKYAFGVDAGEKKGTAVLKRYNIDYGLDKSEKASYDDTVFGGKAMIPPAASTPGIKSKIEPTSPKQTQKQADILKGRAPSELQGQDLLDWMSENAG